MENDDHVVSEGPFAHTQPWGTPEWLDELTAWSHETLKRRNMVMHGELREVDEFDVDKGVMTCMAKTLSKREEGEESSYESIFIKCSIPLTRTVQRTMAAASVFGDLVPEIIGANASQGIVMQRDAGKITNETFDQQVLIETVLKMQMRSMSRIEELERGGLRVRDSEWLEANVGRILNHKLFDDYWVEGFDGEVTAKMRKDRKDYVNRLRSRSGEVEKNCRKITELGLPRTIVHGDLWLQNIGCRVEDERVTYRLFDWEAAFIGNPLHDFQSLLGSYPGTEFCSDFPELYNDWDGGVKQVWKQWKPGSLFTAEETTAVFDILGNLSTLIAIHDLVEEYDASLKKERSIIFRKLSSNLGLLEI